MYKDILDYSYEEVRNRFPKFDCINSARKVITFKNTPDLDTYSNNSDIIVYFDIIGDSRPLLLVERLCYKDAKIKNVKKFVKRINKEIQEYTAMLECSHSEFMDIIVVKSNIYDSVCSTKKK